MYAKRVPKILANDHKNDPVKIVLKLLGHVLNKPEKIIVNDIVHNVFRNTESLCYHTTIGIENITNTRQF